jgi:hypothetical protein
VDGGAPLSSEEEEARQERLARLNANRKRREAAKAAQDASNQQLVILFTLIDGLAEMGLGPEARLLPFEREMIEQPLARMMARLGPATKEIVEAWTDPITLIVGLGFYGVRLAGMYQAKQATKKPPEPFMEAATPISIEVAQPSAGTGAPPPGLTSQVMAFTVNEVAQ